jgi:prefoldin subunit 5
MPNDTTLRGLPLPHPDNIAREDAGRVREAIIEIDAALTVLDAKETPPATEDVSGRVRLATADEATAASATNAVPTIKRTKDMITSALQAAQDALTALQNHVAEELAAADDEIDQALEDLTASINTQLGGFANTLAAKFDKAGGTITGDVSLNKVAGNALNIRGKIAGKDRWVIQLGNGVAEGGANAGSSMSVLRYADDGTLIDTAFAINRATGVINTSAGMAIGGDTRITRSGGTVGYLYFGQPGASFGFDGTYFQSSAWIFSMRGARYADTTDLGGYMPSSTAYGSFVTAVRGVYAGDATEYGSGNYTEIGNAWMTGRRFGVEDNGGYRYRYVQYAINGGWYTAGWAS